MAPMNLPAVKAPTTPALVSVDGRTYPLRSATIRARAEGGVAATTLIQEFANPHDEALEVIYTLPLPADGAVLGYTIHVGERVIRGEVEPRDMAEKEYREALYEGKTAGLLEEDRADTFSQKLGNIPPRTDVRVEIEVLQRLAFLAALQDTPARWEYRFPTVPTVRYPGEPGRVSDPQRISPDRAEAGEIPTRLTLDLTVADSSAAGAPVTSPSHAIRYDASAGATTIRLQEGSPLDKDLVVRWRAATRDVGIHVTEGSGLPGDDGRYALITVTPPEVAAATFRRDLTILLDTSGSMSGAPLETAKGVVARLLESLGPKDRFEVLEFSNETRRLMKDLVAASPKEIQNCLGKLKSLQANGGTEMTAAILEALKPKDLNAQRQVILVTDGQIGFEQEVFDAIVEAGSVVTRLHVAGVGSSPNRALTAGVARVGRGSEVHASDDASVEEAARRLVAGTASPVLVGLEVTGMAVRRVAPERVPDVFAGQPVVVTVELGPKGGALEVTARIAGSDEPWLWKVDVPEQRIAASDENAIPLGALHGRERIADLEAGHCAVSWYRREDWDGMDREIEEIALRHRIVSRRTSLVAIAEEPSVDPTTPRRRERLAVEVPYGMSAEGLGLGREVAMGMMDRALVSFAPSAHEKGLVSRLFDPLRAVTRDRGPSPEVIEAMRFLEQAGRDIAATVISQGAHALVLEFETPFHNFKIPEKGWAIASSVGPLPLVPGDIQPLALVVKESSPLGPYAKGLLVRVSLRMQSGESLPDISSDTVVRFETAHHVVRLRIRLDA